MDGLVSMDFVTKIKENNAKMILTVEENINVDLKNAAMILIVIQIPNLDHQNHNQTPNLELVINSLTVVLIASA